MLLLYIWFATDAVLPTVVSIECRTAMTAAVVCHFVHKTAGSFAAVRNGSRIETACVKQCRGPSVIVTNVLLPCTVTDQLMYCVRVPIQSCC